VRRLKRAGLKDSVTRVAEVARDAMQDRRLAGARVPEEDEQARVRPGGRDQRDAGALVGRAPAEDVRIDVVSERVRSRRICRETHH
jgi:hypothetical protein